MSGTGCAACSILKRSSDEKYLRLVFVESAKETACGRSKQAACGAEHGADAAYDNSSCGEHERSQQNFATRPRQGGVRQRRSSKAARCRAAAVGGSEVRQD